MFERGLLAANRCFARGEAIGLGYHLVADPGVSHVTHLFAYKTPEQFERDLIFVQRLGCFVTYEDLVRAAEGRGPLPDHAFHLSFDDGYAQDFDVVRPLLLKYGVPCTFFITTGFLDNRSLFHRNAVSLCIDRVLQSEPQPLADLIDRLNGRFDSRVTGRQSLVSLLKGVHSTPSDVLGFVQAELRVDSGEFLRTCRPYMSTEQVRRLSAEGFTIGAHSVSHPRFRDLPADDVEHEMAESCRTIRDLLDVREVPFAVPFGIDGTDCRVLEEIRSRHPFIGLVFDIDGVRVDRPFIQNRLHADHPERAALRRSNLPYLLLRRWASPALKRAVTAFRPSARGGRSPLRSSIAASRSIS